MSIIDRLKSEEKEVKFASPLATQKVFKKDNIGTITLQLSGDPDSEDTESVEHDGVFPVNTMCMFSDIGGREWYLPSTRLIYYTDGSSLSFDTYSDDNKTYFRALYKGSVSAGPITVTVVYWLYSI